MTQPFRRFFLARLWQRVPITIVTTIILIAGWSYRYFSASSRATERSHAGTQDIAPKSSSPLPATHSSYTQPAAATHLPVSSFRRVWVAPNEVDYFAEDVTIRLFRPTAKARFVRSGSKQVNIGDDVTVRYFVGQDSPAQTIAHSLPSSK